MAKIELKGISKSWKDFVAVKDIDLTIKDREFIVLLGPSGCGKTTTMRIIAGLEEPTAGKVHIDGEDVTDKEPKDRDVAMVFQSYGLYAHLNVYDNIRFPLKVRKKIATNLHDEKVMAAAKLVQLEDFLHRKPKALSGGQRQRVALARAIVRDPNCFLMDEPLSNLDAKLRASMRTEIRNLQMKLKTTTVYVTHDQVEAMTMADRVAVMRKGKIEQLDTPRNIYARPATVYVAGFIGSPAMNLIKGEVRGKFFVAQSIKIALSGEEIKAVESSSGKPEAVLAVRPEDLSPVAKGGDMSGNIFAVEEMGNLTLVTITVGKQRLIASVGKDSTFKSHKKIQLKTVKGHRLFYCANSGLLLGESKKSTKKKT